MIATIAAARALNDLIETGRMLEPLARRVDPDTSGTLELAIGQLDAARTMLIQEGVAYLDTAWAFVDVGRRWIANYGMHLAKVVGRARP